MPKPQKEAIELPEKISYPVFVYTSPQTKSKHKRKIHKDIKKQNEISFMENALEFVRQLENQQKKAEKPKDYSKSKGGLVSSKKVEPNAK
jgi:hypothetical protein